MKMLLKTYCLFHMELYSSYLGQAKELVINQRQPRGSVLLYCRDKEKEKGTDTCCTMQGFHG